MAQAATVTKHGKNRKSSSGATGSAKSGQERWILNAWADSLLIIGSPLLILVLLTLARDAFSAQAVSGFVMVWAIGHHLPGMMRAYGDRALFSQYRVRFLIAPLVLLGACSFAFFTGVTAGLMALTAAWGWWHYLMQAYGFARIYDAKVGAFAPWTRRLDRAMCLCWFAAAVLLNDNALYGFLSNFYQAGLPLPPPGVVELARRAVGLATAAVTGLFVVHSWRRWRTGQPVSSIKVLSMVATFVWFWYSAATVTNIVVAYAFFELFHDVQYLAIVWAFNRNRVARDPNVGIFSTFLFQARVGLILLYLALIALYGSMRYFGELYTRETLNGVHDFILAVFLTSTLLHYYLDGFIWKLKDRKTLESLHIKAGDAMLARVRKSLPGMVKHTVLWLLFFVPFVLLLFTQVGDAITRREQPIEVQLEQRLQEAERFASIAPRSVMAQYTLGLAHHLMGHWSEAEKAYRAALAIYPQHQATREELSRARRRQPPSVAEGFGSRLSYAR